MVWDKNEPAGNKKIRLSDEIIRENQDCLEDALSRDHKFPGTKGTDAGTHVVAQFEEQAGDPANPAVGLMKLFAKSDGFYLRTSAGVQRKLDAEIPSGTDMLFVESAAPSGWSFIAANDDRMPLITGTEAQGGDTGGNWSLNGISIDNHVLTVAEMPSHRHEGGADQKTAQSGAIEAVSRARHYDDGSAKLYTSYVGSGSGHNHGISNADWRAKYVKVIQCRRD